MRQYLSIALVAITLPVTPALANPVWPTVEIVQPKKIEVVEGCTNPAADVWKAQQQDLLASPLPDDAPEIGHTDNRPQAKASESELPAYLRGDQ